MSSAQNNSWVILFKMLMSKGDVKARDLNNSITSGNFMEMVIFVEVLKFAQS